MNLSCTVIACDIILSSAKLEKRFQHSENSIRISHNLLSPSPSFSLNTIAFIPSGANKQKIKRIDYRKCNVRADK